MQSASEPSVPTYAASKIVSGIILYLVYGVGGRDLGERLEAKARRKRILNRMTGVFRRSGDSAVEEPGEQL